MLYRGERWKDDRSGWRDKKVDIYLLWWQIFNVLDIPSPPHFYEIINFSLNRKNLFSGVKVERKMRKDFPRLPAQIALLPEKEENNKSHPCNPPEFEIIKHMLGEKRVRKKDFSFRWRFFCSAFPSSRLYCCSCYCTNKIKSYDST